MILVDTALKRREREGRPIRVGLVGTGYMGKGIAHQLLTPLPGIALVAISNHRLSGVERVIGSHARAADARVVTTGVELDDCVRRGRLAVTDQANLLCRAELIDLIVDCTGDVEFGAAVAVSAIQHHKHLVLVNAELDATVGPILKRRADEAGVVITNTDGDEPGVAMNLLRFVDTIGYRPVMAGNIKGFYDPHRTPDTQLGFARQFGQTPIMSTSFADGTKLSMETAILANAAGFGVARRGMNGYRCEHVKQILNRFSPEWLLQQVLGADGELPEASGIVDFVLGAEPGTGAFVVGYNDEPLKREYMQYFKMGQGPLYVFYTPFHLPHLQVAVTIGRAALFGDAAVAPQSGPCCEVATMAKRDLKAGEVLDGIGGFLSYGMIDNAAAFRGDQLLPMGLSQGCRLLRDVARDEPIAYPDVQLPAGRLADQLRREQDALFAPTEPAYAAPVNRLFES